MILSAEDGIADTIRPRVEAAGGDPSYIEVIRIVREKDGMSRSFDLQRDLRSLERAIHERGDVVLIVIDPITSYMGSRIDSHRTTDVRAVLEPVASFAERTGVAVLAITHPPKAPQSKAIHAATGSGAYVAAARLVLMVAYDPEDQDRRLLLAVKNNVGPLAEGIGFRIATRQVADRVVAPYINWDRDPVLVTATEAMQANPSGASKVSDAEELLRDQLASGPVPADTLIKEARRLGISERTLRTAKKRLGIASEKDGFQGPSLWSLHAA